MKIYKVPLRDSDGDESEGYSWHLSKREAQKAFKENNADKERGDKVEELNLVMNKYDIIRFLNAYCSYPDNG